jgi:hypothetical protein
MRPAVLCRSYDQTVSVAVSLEELGRRVDEYGSQAFLVTSDGASPHIVSVSVTFDGTAFSVPAGRSSQRNISATATATLLWPGHDDGPYSLIVDGEATHDGERAEVHPTTAVLHRLAEAPEDVPSCVRLESETGGP